MIPGYTISCEKSKMDLKRIHSFISGTYWAFGIPLDVMKTAIENSLCFGVFTDQENQIGFARVITDHVTYAYLGDVFIDERHRSKGLAKWLIKKIHTHPSLQGLRRITLATKDAHGLYETFGYTPLNMPDTFMEKWNPDVYK